MMSQMGSACPAVPARRSAMLVFALALSVKFMSAMLTYFVFMLQKRSCGRKDRTETVLFYPRKSGRTPIGPDRSHSYRVLPGDVKCTKGAKNTRSDAGSRTL